MSTNVTSLLRLAARGDKKAEADLLARIYGDLHRIARGHLRRERSGHTLQPTALVHEAFIRLTSQQDTDWKDRAHFFGIAAQLMRRILVDYARQRNALKRGAGNVKVDLEEGLTVFDKDSALIIDVDRALKKLEELSPRQARIVEVRFFSGLTEEETAEVLEVSSRTVKRDWAMARAWLYAELAR